MAISAFGAAAAVAGTGTSAHAKLASISVAIAPIAAAPITVAPAAPVAAAPAAPVAAAPVAPAAPAPPLVDVLRPRVLPNGAPACGNVISKSYQPDLPRRCRANLATALDNPLDDPMRLTLAHEARPSR